MSQLPRANRSNSAPPMLGSGGKPPLKPSFVNPPKAGSGGAFQPGLNATQKMGGAQASRAQGVNQVQSAMAPKKALLANLPNGRKDASQPGIGAQAAIRPAVKQIASADKTINALKAGPKGPAIASTRTQQARLGPKELGAARLPSQPAQPGLVGAPKVGPLAQQPLKAAQRRLKPF